MIRSRFCPLVLMVAGLVLSGALPSRSAEPPNLSGVWKLNHELSDDADAKIKAAAGSQYVQGRPEFAAETILPWGRKFNEGERLLLRDVLVGAVHELETLELEQTAAEVKTIHGEAGVRIFYLKREGTGSSLVTGESVRRHAEWEADKLVLKSDGGKTKTREVFTLAPDRAQLVHLLHVEMDLLKHAIDLRLVYDRADVR